MNSVPKIELKYDEDRCSPLNPTGKKEYDREFLLSLQQNMYSLAKPENLPDLPDVILENCRFNEQHARPLPNKSYTISDFLPPGWMKSLVGSSSVGRDLHKAESSWIKSMQVKKMKEDEEDDDDEEKSTEEIQPVTSSSIEQPIRRHKAQFPWFAHMQIMKQKYKDYPHNEELVIEQMLRKMRGILNKLTPQKFAKLIGQIQELEINTETRLTGVTDLIFEKAIDEPKFSVPYALLCKTLSSLAVQPEGNIPGAKPITFRVKLLARCQAELDKDKANEIELGNREAEIHAEDPTHDMQQAYMTSHPFVSNQPQHQTQAPLQGGSPTGANAVQGQVGGPSQPYHPSMYPRVQGSSQQAPTFYTSRPTNPQTLQRPVTMNPSQQPQYAAYQSVQQYQMMPAGQPGYPSQILYSTGAPMQMYNGRSPMGGTQLFMMPQQFPQMTPQFTGTEQWMPTGYSYQQVHQGQFVIPQQGRPPTGHSQLFTAQQQGPPQMTQAPPPRERKVIRIQDPNSGQDVTDDIIGAGRITKSATPPQQSSSGNSRGATPNATAVPTAPKVDIAAQFAQQVAATLRPTESTPPMLKSETEIESVEHIQEHSRPTESTEEDIPDNDLVDDSVDDVTEHFAAHVVASLQSEQKENGQRESRKLERREVPFVPEVHLHLDEATTTEGASVKRHAEYAQIPTKAVSEAPTKAVSEAPTKAVSEAPTKAVSEAPTKAVSEPKPDVEERTEMVTTETKQETPLAPRDNDQGKKNRKQRTKELNERGKGKEGTDMDLFRDVDSATAETKPLPPVQGAAPVARAPPTQVTSVPVMNHVATATPSDVVTPTTAVDDDKENEPLATPNDDVENVDPVQQKNDRNHVPDDVDRKSVPKIELKYNYREDQWSPLNPEGKKQYDREFLLSLQMSSLSKPDNLPDLPDVILENSAVQSRFNEQHTRPLPNKSYTNPDFFTPGYVKSMVGTGSSSRQGPGSIGRRGSQPSRGSRDQKPQRVIEIPIAPPVELHKAESSWAKSMQEKKKEVCTDDDQEKFTEELFRKMRGILNKLTPQKFAKLIGQIQELEINTETRLTGVIDLIFEKAIDEPNFSVPYALLCKTLSSLVVQPEGNIPGAKPITFRVKLLARCQAEFEKDKANEIELGKREAEIHAEDDEKKKKMLELELEEAQAKSKRRSTGNIRFIGELFKLKMLTEKIMHQCLTKLLQQKDEESLECLCRLFTTIGKGIDNTREAKTQMDTYFIRMQTIIDEKLTSARIRFLMLDVIDLRQNNWVPRRTTNDPKTIDQIHKEAAAEKEREAMMAAQDNHMRPNKPRGGGSGQRGGPMGGQRVDDGWTTVSTKPLDMSRMKLTKQNVDEHSVQLGPGFRPGQSWGRGSTGGSKQPEVEPKPSIMGNRFSALDRQPNDSRGRGAGRGLPPTPGRPSAERSGRPQQTMPRRQTGGRGSQESDRESALAAVRSISGTQQQHQQHYVRGSDSRGNSRDNSRSRDGSANREFQRPSDLTTPRESSLTRAEPATTMPKMGKMLTASEMESKAKAILEEYLHIDDKKEALHCISELEGQKLMNVFVEHCYNHVLERSESARKHTALLLHDCVKQGFIQHEDFLTAVKAVIELAEDFEIDIPKIWQYLGELIGPMMEDSTVPLSCLSSICLPIPTHNKRALLVLAVLKYINHREGHGRTGSLWRASGLQWSEFVDYQGEEMERFISDKKLEYTLSKEEAPSNRTLSLTEIQTELKTLLQRDAPDEEIFDWIELNVGEVGCKDPKFIRALMTEVCTSAIKVSGSGTPLKFEKNTSAIEHRAHVLQKYIDHEQELELQSLYALQALVHSLEHPSGLLMWFFEQLYDLDILSDDAFRQWRSSTDPAELQGHAVAKKSVNPFLSSLDEDDVKEGVEES